MAVSDWPVIVWCRAQAQV